MFSCVNDGLLTIWGAYNGPPLFFAQFGGSPGGPAVVPLFGLLRTMAVFLPSESRALCDIDRAINSQSTFVSRPPGCNQLSLHVLMCRASLWGSVCVSSCSHRPFPGVRLLSPMPTLGASAALHVALFQQPFPALIP